MPQPIFLIRLYIYIYIFSLFQSNIHIYSINRVILCMIKYDYAWLFLSTLRLSKDFNLDPYGLRVTPNRALLHNSYWRLPATQIRPVQVYPLVAWTRTTYILWSGKACNPSSDSAAQRTPWCWASHAGVRAASISCPRKEWRAIHNKRLTEYQTNWNAMFFTTSIQGIHVVPHGEPVIRNCLRRRCAQKSY